MTTAIKRRRGTTTQHSTFTGLEGEITVDSTKDTVVVHDGSTAGGFALLREDLSNNTNVITTTNTKTLTNKTFSDNPVFSAGTANGVAYLNGSKVLTTGSALTFDGSTLSVTNKVLASAPAGTAPTFYLGQAATSAWSIKSPASVDALAFVNEQFGAEMMRLTSTGLGIGTSSPASKLHVSGGDIQLSAGNSLKYSSTAYITPENNVSGAEISTTGIITFKAGSGPTERMRLDASGNLGLGVTPSAWGGGFKAMQYLGGSVSSQTSGYLYTSQNAYYNGTNWTYSANGGAVQYEQSNAQHQWKIAGFGTAGNAISFTQVMTLDASGNLGVNTTSPNFANTDRAFAVNGAGTASLGLKVADTGAGVLVSGNGYTTLADSRASTVMVFSVAGSERMRIDSDGNVLVGTTATIGSTVEGVQIGSNGTGQIFTRRNTTDPATQLAFFNPNGNVGSISSSGTTVSYATSSDYRLKENIQPMQNALGVVAQLNPVTYTWKADGSDGQGFIAHELQAVVPDCVTGEKDAVDKDGKPVYQGVDTSFLVATLTAAIKELKAELDATKAEVAALKGV